MLLPARLSEDELAYHYCLATALMLNGEKEGFTNVSFEDLDRGRPVLAGNRDGSVDPLGDGGFGLLVDPHLPLAPALASLLAQQGENLWFQPQELSLAVRSTFGFDAFCERLECQLAILEVG